jgi:AraC family transcriptional regulator, glycine betaine-responsive activator
MLRLAKADDLPDSDILMSKSDLSANSGTVLFVLAPGFPLMAYASAVEPLRAANVLSGRSLYTWRHMTAGPGEARASNGVAFRPDFDMAREPTPAAVLVCSGGNPATFSHPPTLARLRRFARRGAKIGGVSAGAFILAQAGLLDGYRCTIHWEHASAFAEAFPHLTLTRSLYEIDRDRLTSAGGIAALDMMHAMIRDDHGQALAAAVSDWFIQTSVRSSADRQRLSIRERYGVGNPKVARVLQRMEDETQRPAGRMQLAALAGVSVRQLERLFATHLSRSIDEQYKRVRLERARKLVAQTALPIVEIALICGFRTASHFSRSYKAAYGRAPQRERAREKA